MNGVIWSKTQKTFVPISSVPTYAMMQQERFRQSRALEIHNFQLQNFTLTSFQEPHFLHFYNNNTKVTGLCGEIWNLLSESLNFTLQPVKANVNGLGMSEKDRSFKNGLLGIIFRNETMAIPKLETFISRLVATEFSVPFWINRIQLYIHPEVIYDGEWMLKIFCWKIWCTILIMCVLLSLCTFLTQNIFIHNENKRKNVSFSEHIFYNFGNFCNQSYIPEYLNGKSRILEVSLGLFCSMICTSFSAVLFMFLSKSGFVPPFDKFESMIYNTKFSVVTLKDSIGETLFKVLTTDSIERAKKSNRLIVVSTLQEMHKKICSLPDKYAMFQNEEMHKVNGEIKCHLINIGEEFIRTWVTSGIVKNFKYKRTIDVGILKLIEVGLLSALKDRWMENKFKQYEDDQKPKPIELHQVSLIIVMMCCGAIIALVIFIIEKIVFAYKVKQF
ncbi:GRIA1 protein, partial [Acromyrmex insinuator]